MKNWTVALEKRICLPEAAITNSTSWNTIICMSGPIATVKFWRHLGWFSNKPKFRGSIGSRRSIWRVRTEKFQRNGSPNLLCAISYCASNAVESVLSELLSGLSQLICEGLVEVKDAFVGDTLSFKQGRGPRKNRWFSLYNAATRKQASWRPVLLTGWIRCWFGCSHSESRWIRKFTRMHLLPCIS